MAPVVTMRQLLESGVHFGHQTRRWNPKMKRFIFAERNGIYIIDLQQSLDFIDRAYETRLWPLLGFLFMPLTTIAYAWAHIKHGSVEGIYFAVVLLAVLADLGIIGGGARGRRDDD